MPRNREGKKKGRAIKYLLHAQQTIVTKSLQNHEQANMLFHITLLFSYSSKRNAPPKEMQSTKKLPNVQIVLAIPKKKTLTDSPTPFF
jgi:hypothetical protein